MTMRNLGLLIFLILILPTNLFGQENSSWSKTLDTIVYKISDLDLIPKFVYSKGELQKDKIRAYIKDNQLWPTQDDGIFIVYVKFVIEKEGTISNIAITKGIHPDYNKEAIRLIKSMPNWKPGIKSGHLVRTEMIIPIKWTILND